MNWIKLIENWYHQNKRDLPWRNEIDPYKIWISEIILQQTKVEQGLDYYCNFISRFPDLQSLANAEEADVLKIWQGLGYYSRARNMQTAATQIINIFSGKFPETKEELMTLKGIGPYTSSAISSIAFDKPDPVVDGNVYRFISRFFDVNMPINSTKSLKYFTKILQTFINKSHPGTFNQSLMEFGATVCKPHNPECQLCPVSFECLSFKKGTIRQRPVVPAKNKPLVQYFNYLHLIDCDNPELMYLTKREQGIWKGLYEFPLIISDNPLSNEMLVTVLKNMIDIRQIDLEYMFKHQLTHKTIHAKFRKILIDKKNDLKKLSTFEIKLNEISDFPIHRLMDKYLHEINFYNHD